MGPRPCAVLLVVPLAFRAPRGVLLGRAAWCARGRRPSCLCCLWPHGCSGRRRARPPARSPHASLTARSGRSRSPPVPSGPSGVLHTSGVWSLCVPVGGGPPASRPRRELRSARCLEARPGLAFTPQASCPAPAHIAAETAPNFARNSPTTLSNIEFRSLELQRFKTLLILFPIELRAKLRGRGLVSAMVCCRVHCLSIRRNALPG